MARVRVRVRVRVRGLGLGLGVRIGGEPGRVRWLGLSPLHLPHTSPISPGGCIDIETFPPGHYYSSKDGKLALTLTLTLTLTPSLRLRLRLSRSRGRSRSRSRSRSLSLTRQADAVLHAAVERRREGGDTARPRPHSRDLLARGRQAADGTFPSYHPWLMAACAF